MRPTPPHSGGCAHTPLPAGTFHCGGANTSGTPRAQLYATFREGDDGGRRAFAMRRELVGRYALRDFMCTPRAQSNDRSNT